MESKETIKITGMVKLYAEDRAKNFFTIKNSFDAEEIFFIAKQLRGLQAKQMVNINFRSFGNNYFYRNDCFVTKDPNLLSTDNIYSILNLEQGKNSLTDFLASKNLDSLQVIYGDFQINLGKRRTQFYGTKEELIKLLIADPMKLISPTLLYAILEFLRDFLISWDRLKYDNCYIESSSALGIKEPIIFNFRKLKGLTSGRKPRFFKLTCNTVGYSPSMITFSENFQDFQNFYLTTKSIMTKKDCILDMEDSNTLEVLKEFVSSVSSNKEFLLEPIGYVVKREDLQKMLNSDEEEKKFKVKWPNNLEGLTNLFGKRVKSKFLTLKNGLELLERLEPSKKFIELMQGEKILFDLYTFGSFRTIMGIPLEAKALEVLILHSKLESIQGNLLICKVQEKITEETLAYIWQRVESGPIRRYAEFSGYRLTE